MNKFRFDAFLMEFPFLKGIIEEYNRDHTNIDSVGVQRVDEHMLKMVCQDHYFDGSAGNSVDWDHLWVVKASGAEKIETQNDFSRGSNYAHSKSEKSKGESILTALEGHENASHLVIVTNHVDDWSGRESEYEFTITIYKAAKRTTIAAEILSAKAAHLHFVRMESGF